MPQSKIPARALSTLSALATWLESATMQIEGQIQKDGQTQKESEKQKEGNLLRCVDNDRFAKTEPLLRALGYSIPGRGYALYRVSGKAEIVKEEHLKTLFFPLSIRSGRESIASGEVEVAEEKLVPGTFIQLDQTVPVYGQLDCLVVYLPES